MTGVKRRTATQDTPAALMTVQELEKEYQLGRRRLEVLHGVDLEVRAGEMLAVVGPSGAGKSTLLHLMGILDTPTRGRILYQDEVVSGLSEREKAWWRNRLFGFVFQFYHLLPDFTALENVALPTLAGGGMTGWRGRRREAFDRARDILEKVELEDRAEHRPSQLSGGERQRVAIARALVNEPEVLLCDEPTGNLDRETGSRILDLLCSLHDRIGTTIVMVTHDEQLASRAERTVQLIDGRIAG